MKLEPTFQKEKCTVSWHADSTLEHYSSIAVYHCTRQTQTKKIKNAEVKKKNDKKNEKKNGTSSIIDTSIDSNKKSDIKTPDESDAPLPPHSGLAEEEEDKSWRISLRVHPNAEGPKAGKLKTAVETR